MRIHRKYLHAWIGHTWLSTWCVISCLNNQTLLALGMICCICSCIICISWSSFLCSQRQVKRYLVFFPYTLIKTDADVSDIGELLIKNHQPQTAATCKVRVTQKKWGSWASLHFSRKLLKTKVLLEKSCTTVIDKWLIFKGFLDLCLKSLFSFIL